MNEFVEKYVSYGLIAAVLIVLATAAGTKFPWSSPDNRSRGGTSKGAKGRNDGPSVPSADNPRPYSNPKPTTS